MSVSLDELVPSLRREVAQPGAEATTFPDANDDIFLGYLQDAFWEIRLDQMLPGYTESDGIVTPTDSDDDDLGRDMQQLIVVYAGMRIIRNQLLAMNTMFRSKAGPVEFETQKSAQTLKAAYDDLVARRNYILATLADSDGVDSYYIDAILERDDAMTYGAQIWWR